MVKIIKIVLIAVPVLVVLAVATLSLLIMNDGGDKYYVSTIGTSIPKFTEVDIAFDHQLEEAESLPFMGSAIIDIDNDGVRRALLGRRAGPIGPAV